MTAPRRNGIEEPFNAWIRNHPELRSSPSGAALSVMDVDFVIHKYLVSDKANGSQLHRQHIMLLEHKCFMAEKAYAQKDTINALDQMLNCGHLTIASLKRGYVKMFYHGFHCVRFENTCPTDSDRILWDERPIRTATLVKLLRFEVDANTLRPREDRSHHKAHPALDEAWVRATA